MAKEWPRILWIPAQNRRREEGRKGRRGEGRKGRRGKQGKKREGGEEEGRKGRRGKKGKKRGGMEEEGSLRSEGMEPATKYNSRFHFDPLSLNALNMLCSCKTAYSFCDAFFSQGEKRFVQHVALFHWAAVYL